MSNFPGAIDDDVTLPAVTDNITEIGAEAINALRDAVFAIENNIGIGAAGTVGSLANRVGVSLFPDGTIKPSAIASLGLVTLPITNGQIADNAGIPESKLKLDFRTQDLYNYITDLVRNVNLGLGWISTTGVKLDPHLLGALYRHSLSHIDVDADPNNFFKNKFNTFRDNTNSYTALNDLNNEFLYHQWADGSITPPAGNITTHNGSVYPSYYGHTSSGIFLNSSRFAIIPQTVQDLQAFAEFIDSASIFLLGTRIQNLYSNGISRISSASTLNLDGYGQGIIPPTPAIAYLKNVGNASSPVDDIDTGDDIIEFKPLAADVSSNTFDEKFALVKVGDIIRINYGSIEVPFVIKEKKYKQSGGNKTYLVRIAGKNLLYAPRATARIDKPLANNNKYGSLAIAPANCYESGGSVKPSLIVGSPRGAQALGLGFNPDQFDTSHYLLYLALYPTGNPLDGYTVLPGIDVTGDNGKSAGNYTLESIVEATNKAFRTVGFNYRFIAFSYQGEFGIMLADSYNDAAFSIISGVVDSNGNYSSSATAVAFGNNVVDVFATSGQRPIDPLGFGISGANIASPPLQTTYASAEQSIVPTKLFVPFRRQNYYVNGAERDRLSLDIGQTLDGYGDGYWFATITGQTIFPGPSPTGRVATTYTINQDLSASGLKIGKTLVVQPLGEAGLTDFGRFIIQGININCSTTTTTDITVFDAVHATGVSPSTVLPIGSQVRIYFNYDSVSFNNESATDFTSTRPFRRHFEVYVDKDGKTFSHERGRINILGSTITINGSIPLYSDPTLDKLNIVKISSKLRGYQFGSVNKITLLANYDSASGRFSGNLASYDGTNFSHKGPTASGRIGEVIRIYDETNIDYIDIMFNLDATLSTVANAVIDFQLFPSLTSDPELMFLGTAQTDDITNIVNFVRDERQFGNTSEKDFSTSALNLISLPEKLLHSNGVVRGFDLELIPITGLNPNKNQIYLNGGIALVNGKIIQMNNETVTIPFVWESPLNLNINWALCINDKGEYQPIPLLDYDPDLGTPSTVNRVFTVQNPISGLVYNIDAIKFSDLINLRKDLTLLYIVQSMAVIFPALDISLNVLDARRYVADADSNFPLKVASAQSNFHSSIAAFNWLRFNSFYNGNIITHDVASISTPLRFDFANQVTIDGENIARLTFNGKVTLGSKVTFKNIQLTFNGGIDVLSNMGELTFDNCVITINVPNPAPAGNIVFNFVNSGVINFHDNVITVNYTQNVSGGAVFNLDTVNLFNATTNIMAVNFAVTAGVTYPGNVFNITNSINTTIDNLFITGNFNALIKNSGSSSMRLVNSSINSTYNPALDLGYNILNLVNSGNGYIYSEVTGTLSDIVIDNNTFQYSPAVSSADRFSFINFELSQLSSVLSNLSITNCKFIGANIGGSVEDFRPAIAIINTNRVGGGNPNGQQPILRHAQISNNYCNRIQAIIVTSKSDTDRTMKYPGLVAENCTIRDNICGSIGYWIGRSSKNINTAPNVNQLPDKESGLLIENNTCHYIGNLDHLGAYFPVNLKIGGNTTNVSSYPSGFVVIRGNKANWIHVGIAYEENSSLHILDNVLTAYDPNYLFIHSDLLANSVTNGTTNSNGYAIFVSANKHNTGAASPGTGNDSNCVISGNITNTGYWFTPILTTVNYNYVSGYIWSQSSAIIKDNVLKGIFVTAGGTAILVAVGGTKNIVTNNRIYRNGGEIFSYVGYINYEIPTWDGTGVTGIVTDNYFDSPFVDLTNSDLVVNIDASGSFTGSTNWVVERNVNQTVYLAIPITNSQMGLTSDGYFGGTPTNLYIKTANSAGVNATAMKSMVLHLVDGDTGSTQRDVTWQENLDKYMPNGARLIELKMGMRTFGSLVNGLSVFTLYLNKYTPTSNYLDLDYFANANSVDTKVVNDGTGPTSSMNAGVINSSSTTQYFDIDLTTVGPGDISGQYVAGQGHSFSASLRLSYHVDSAPNFDLLFSPLMVKYRW